MNIELSINRVPISLGRSFREIIDEDILKDYFQKMGFFSKLIIRAHRADTVYFSKNCLIQCFNEKFTVSSFTELGFPSDWMFGTTAYLFFKENHLYKVVFQIIKSEYAAKKYANEFRVLCREHFGEPTDKNELFEIWEMPDSMLISKWNTGMTNSYFSLIARRS